MRKKWFALWAAAGIAAGQGTIGHAAAPASAPAAGVAPTTTKSWTERITAPLKTNPLKMFKGKPSSFAKKTQPPEETFDPANATPELYVGLAQMSQRAGNIAQARQLYQQALAKAPNHREALLGAARMEDREGQLDTALMLYQRAVTAAPKDATSLNDLGLCYARRGELPRAHQTLEQAIRLDATNPLYRNNVAKVLVELNAIDPAMQNLTAVHPPAVANYNMAVLLAERGRQQEANFFLSQALEIDPQMGPAQMMLAQQSAPVDETAAAVAAGSLVQPSAPALVQSGVQAAKAAAESAESILPTPEVVATVPWGPSLQAPTQYPSTVPSPVVGPAGAAVGTSPALLPPVR